jgi:hypothetical protein
MVGRINISRQADAVRHLFMALEKSAKKIGSCWFCGTPLSTMKLANQGYLKGNHTAECLLGQLADAGETCIKLRDVGTDSEKAAAEQALEHKITDLLHAMKTHECPFPVCEYSSGHRVECPFHAFERDTGN